MTLTDEDRARIDAAWAEYIVIDPRKRYAPPPGIGGLREYFYIAGIKAGLERAAKAVEQGVTVMPNFDKDWACANELADLLNHPNIYGKYAAAIRAIAAEGKL